MGRDGADPQEMLAMVDTARSAFPADLDRSAREPGGRGQIEALAEETLDSLKHYAREHPGSALLWALGIGFVLGWKLKPSW